MPADSHAGSGNSLCAPAQARCSSPGGNDPEEALTETLWCHQVRASIKSRGREPERPPASCASLRSSPYSGAGGGSGGGGTKQSGGGCGDGGVPRWGAAPQAAELSPSLAEAETSICLKHQAVERSIHQAGEAALERARTDAKARMSAYFEDLISFLEMHSLSGAYALAFSANGIEDLSQLLLLEDGELDHLIKKCDIDAMDEILLRDALRGVRASSR